MATDLSAIDLYLLSGHLGADRRIELTEGVILEATSNSIGQYILVVIGRASGSDYAPLQAYIQTELARPLPSSRAEPFAEPAMTLGRAARRAPAHGPAPAPAGARACT